MLDSPKAQAVYQALQSSSGFHSSAGDKAVKAISQSTELHGQLGELTKLPKEGIPPGGGLPVIVPKEIRAAAAKLDTYKGAMSSTMATSEALSGAIGQRMDNVTGNMARMNAANSVAQKMQDVPGGCGPLGAAFSVLTSEGQTELLNSLLTSLGGPMGDLADIFEQALALNTSSLPAPLKAALDAAMSACSGLMTQITSATGGIQGLVDESQAMWAKLDSIFTEAIQSSILVSLTSNSCMMAVIDAVSPPEVSDILNSPL